MNCVDTDKIIIDVFNHLDLNEIDFTLLKQDALDFINHQEAGHLLEVFLDQCEQKSDRKYELSEICQQLIKLLSKKESI